MYVDTCHSGIYVHYILRDSYRQDGKIIHRTIANLSNCSSAEIQAIQIVQKLARRVAVHGDHGAGRLGRTQNALHDGIADARPAADVGTKVFRKGKSRLIGSSTAPRRKSSHEKEAADKMRNPLILQRIIVIRSTGFYWNIRYMTDSAAP